MNIFRMFKERAAEASEGGQYSPEIIDAAKQVVFLLEGNRVANEPNPQLDDWTNQLRNELQDAESSDEAIQAKAVEIAKATSEAA